MEIYKIFDNGGATIDRYTVFFKYSWARKQDEYAFLGLSDNPDHPQGFSQWGLWNRQPEDWVAQEEIKFSELPENVQRNVLRRMEED